MRRVLVAVSWTGRGAGGAGAGSGGRRRVRLCRIRREAGKPGHSSGFDLRRQRILHPDQGQGMAAQDILGLGELGSAGKLSGVLEVEHHRRVQKKPRTAPDLLGEVLLEGRIAQQSGAHHHDGEDRALHEIARHPRTDAACRAARVYGLTPNRPCRNGFRRATLLRERNYLASRRASAADRLGAIDRLFTWHADSSTRDGGNLIKRATGRAAGPHNGCSRPGCSNSVPPPEGDLGGRSLTEIRSCSQ